MNPRIDFDGLDAAYQTYRDSLLPIIDAVLQTGRRLEGEEVERFEEACASLLGRRHVLAVNSGTDALLIALRSAGVGPGDEVIVTAFSFVASASCIVLTGAVPVFVDVDPCTLLMDLNKLEGAITPRTKAIVLVQLYGQCVDFQPLAALADRHGLPIVEDAAQALGSSWNGRPGGSFGEVSALSFDPMKVMPGITTGGLLATDRAEIYQKARSLRYHGFNPRTADYELLGYHSEMSEVNAAILTWQLAHDNQWRRQREAVARRYEQMLCTLPAMSPVVRVARPGNNYHKYVLLAEDRDVLATHLREHGIPVRVHYPRALPDWPVLRGRGRCVGLCSHARRAAAQVLSLPMHPFLTDDQVDSVLAVLSEYAPVGAGQ